MLSGSGKKEKPTKNSGPPSILLTKWLQLPTHFNLQSKLHDSLHYTYHPTELQHVILCSGLGRWLLTPRAWRFRRCRRAGDIQHPSNFLARPWRFPVGVNCWGGVALLNFRSWQLRPRMRMGQNHHSTFFHQWITSISVWVLRKWSKRKKEKKKKVYLFISFHM